MIKFITDVRPGETPFPSSLFKNNLTITNLDGALKVTVAHPYNGWTHKKLELLALEIENSNHIISNKEHGLDAYLGADWVGSTEV